jgi:hypothetical protein
VSKRLDCVRTQVSVFPLDLSMGPTTNANTTARVKKKVRPPHAYSIVVPTLPATDAMASIALSCALRGSSWAVRNPRCSQRFPLLIAEPLCCGRDINAAVLFAVGSLFPVALELYSACGACVRRLLPCLFPTSVVGIYIHVDLI